MASRRVQPSSRSRYTEELPHGLEGAGELLPLAREAESEVALPRVTEIGTGDAADAAVLDQVLGHRPGRRRGGVRGRALPRRIDPNERVEGAIRRLAGEDPAKAANALVEQVASGAQLRCERPDAVLRP